MATVIQEKTYWPAAAPDIANLADGATMTYTVDNGLTLLTIDQMAQNGTLTVTKATFQRPGDMLKVRFSSDATARTLTLAGDAEAVAIAGTISKSVVADLLFDGSNFKVVGVSAAF